MWYQLSDGRALDMSNFRAIEPMYTHDNQLVCVKCTHNNGDLALYTGRAGAEIMAYMAQEFVTSDAYYSPEGEEDNG